MDLSTRDLENLVQEARRLGARGVEILVDTAEHTLTTVQGRNTPRTTRHQTAHATVRCWLDDGRQGAATAAPDAITALAAEALQRAAATAPDALAGPVGRLAGPARGLGIDDPRHPQLTDDDRAEVVLTNERAAARGSRVETGTFTFRDTRERRVFANSKGVIGDHYATTYEATGLARAHGVTLHEQIAGRAFASIACLPLGAALADRAALLASDTEPVDGEIRVLLPPRATARIVAWLADRLDDATLRSGRTFLSTPSDGPLLHRRLHLVDDGLLSGGLRTRPFDDHGVPPIPLTLIREGDLLHRLLDTPTARRRDTRPTGHVENGQLRPSNLQLNSGSRSVHALLGELGGSTFAVDELPPLGPEHLDEATGAFSVPVAGVLRQGQKVIGARRQAVLSGNLLHALQAVPAISADTDRILHVDAPAIFLDRLRVTG